MNPIQLGIKFVRGYEPTPVPVPVPGSGTGSTSGLAQTGDFKVAIIAGLILLALTIVGMVAYALIKNRKLAGANSSISTVFQQLNFSNFSMRAKVVGTLMMIVAVTCIFLGCFSTNAHAADGAGSPLVPDKSEITAKVNKDGTFTLDTCTLTNNGTEKYTIEKSSVSIAEESSEIEGLDDSVITVEGFNGTLYTGNPEAEFAPQDLQDLEAGAYTTLSFSISLPEGFDVEALFNKQVFTISLTPKQVATWIPMQAKANAETKPIDFYPAFSDTSQIAGYKFATYDGTNYYVIQDINSMSDIYNALQQSSTGEKTTTLYYQITSSTAPTLMCYTVKDLSWNYVFGQATAPSGGVAEAYSQEFIHGYQRDGENNNGITTALLVGDGFGRNWDAQSGIPKLSNNVNYADNGGTETSENGGFYGCYGGPYGGLLSYSSDFPWGCYATNENEAFCFEVVTYDYWGEYNRATAINGVVLARAFN